MRSSYPFIFIFSFFLPTTLTLNFWEKGEQTHKNKSSSFPLALCHNQRLLKTSFWVYFIVVKYLSCDFSMHLLSFLLPIHTDFNFYCAKDYHIRICMHIIIIHRQEYKKLLSIESKTKSCINEKKSAHSSHVAIKLQVVRYAAELLQFHNHHPQ